MVDPFLGKVAKKTTSLSTSEDEFVAASQQAKKRSEKR